MPWPLRREKLLGMTTTMDDNTTPPPPDGGLYAPPPPPPPEPRRLRRSRTDRRVVGLCGGLGEYFGVDPVIFRVLVAVLSLFGGSGIALYLIGWLIIPEQGAVNSLGDRMTDNLRNRRVPFALAAVVVLFVAWLVLFSWWAPHGLFAALVVTVAVLALLSWRGRNLSSYRAPTPTWTGPVGPWSAPPANTPMPSYTGPSEAPLPPAMSQLRSWYEESRDRARLRRSRSRPVKTVTLLLTLITLGVLAAADASHGIRLSTYFWVGGGIVLAGLIVGVALRRTPWSIATLLVPALVGVIAYGTSPVRGHDGWGDKQWAPTSASALHSTYRTAFGRSTLDLTSVTTVPADASTRIVLGSGQVRLIIPKALPVQILSDVHIGAVRIDDETANGGLDLTRTFTHAIPATGGPVLTINVKIATGELDITYV
jgi:phage shock protein PspC (stress-responsive transcriptional regulator)